MCPSFMIRSCRHLMSVLICCLITSPAWAFEFFVITLTDKTIAIDAEAGDSIANVKSKIQDKEGIPVDFQNLVFAGQLLENDSLVGSYGIKAGSTIFIVMKPDAPGVESVTPGDMSATVAFSAPENDGGSAISGYKVTSDPSSVTAVCASSPCTVTGLINGTSYVFTIVASNIVGDSEPSVASDSITPAAVPDAPLIGVATAGNAQAQVAFTASHG